MSRVLAIVFSILYVLFLLFAGIGIIWLIDLLFSDEQYRYSKYLKEMQCYEYGQTNKYRVYYNVKTSKCKVQKENKMIEIEEKEYSK